MKTPREVLLDPHRATQVKLDRLRQEVVAKLGEQAQKSTSPQPRPARNPVGLLFMRAWTELIRPCRLVWTGLAAIWVVIVGLNLPEEAAAQSGATRTVAVSPQFLAALREQERMRAELLAGPEEIKAAARGDEADGASPRSQGRQEVAVG